MKELFATIPNIGTLYFHHVYLFYDQPQIFSCKDEHSKFYIVLLIESNGDYDEWLLVAITKERLKKAEDNIITIREIFTLPETGHLWKVNFADDFVSLVVSPECLTDNDLPEAGEYLDYNGYGYNDESYETAIFERPLRPQVVCNTMIPCVDNPYLPDKCDTPIIAAQKENRDIIDISLEIDDGHMHEIPCSSLSQVLENVQQLIYAIGDRNGGIFGPISSKVKQNCTMVVAGSFSASFGIRLKSDELSDISCETPLTSVLGEFNNLLTVSDDREELKAFLSNQNPRVAVKYRKLIKSLISSKTGIRVENASPNKAYFNKHFTTKELISNLKLIDSEIEETVTKETLYGRLEGVVHDKGTFEFVSTANERIRGKLAPNFKDSVFSVPSTVEAVIEVKTGKDDFGEEKYVYQLLEIHQITSKS